MSTKIKKIAVAVVVVLILVMLAGCGVTDEEACKFNATIIQINGHVVIVEPMAGENILSSSNRISFNTDGLEDIGAFVGDIVTIIYTGEIWEIYPAMIDVISWSMFCKNMPE